MINKSKIRINRSTHTPKKHFTFQTSRRRVSNIFRAFTLFDVYSFYVPFFIGAMQARTIRAFARRAPESSSSWYSKIHAFTGTGVCPGVTIVYGDLERKLHPSQVVESAGEEAWQTSVEDEAINYEIQLRSRAHGRYTSRLRRYFK